MYNYGLSINFWEDWYDLCLNKQLYVYYILKGRFYLNPNTEFLQINVIFLKNEWNFLPKLIWNPRGVRPFLLEFVRLRFQLRLEISGFP